LFLAHNDNNNKKEGGMTLYVKAGPDGPTSLGDCPFAQYVRMVLELKQLPYALQPCTGTTKPAWLVEYYGGKLPALRHQKECYVESDMIASYLDYFFPDPELSGPAEEADEAAAAAEGLFPALAQYLKHAPASSTNTEDGDYDAVDAAKRAHLEAILSKLDAHLGGSSNTARTGPYLCGDGTAIRLNDCKLAPILYHMTTAIPALKKKSMDLSRDFPAVYAYAEHMFQHNAAFQKTVYPPEVVVWGWENARK
jgi:glutathione S-transferase